MPGSGTGVPPEELPPDDVLIVPLPTAEVVEPAPLIDW